MLSIWNNPVARKHKWHICYPYETNPHRYLPPPQNTSNKLCYYFKTTGWLHSHQVPQNTSNIYATCLKHYNQKTIVIHVTHMKLPLIRWKSRIGLVGEKIGGINIEKGCNHNLLVFKLIMIMIIKLMRHIHRKIWFTWGLVFVVAI